MNYFNRSIETLIVFNTYGRREISTVSLRSLIETTRTRNVRIVVSDATPRKNYTDELLDLEAHEYIWTPGDINSSISRNIAVSLSRDKYVFDWLLFVEDDLTYHKGWYETLITTATSLYGRKSPLGLAYGVFSAAEAAVKSDETVLYDNVHDVYASMFGLRADQRLYKASHYFNVGLTWDSDIFGISSCQTGKQSHRDLMRGFCGCSIGHRGLVSEVDGQTSTWFGKRDIGPAAFDKRTKGYDGLLAWTSSAFTTQTTQNALERFPENAPCGEVTRAETEPLLIKSDSSIPMTAVPISSGLSWKGFLRRLKKAFGIILRGRG